MLEEVGNAWGVLWDALGCGLEWLGVLGHAGACLGALGDVFVIRDDGLGCFGMFGRSK